MALGTKNASNTKMKMTVQPKQRNTQNYIDIKMDILDQFRKMIASFQSQNYGEDA